MKRKLLAALLAGAVAVSMVACGGSGSSSSSTPAPAADASTGEAAAPAGGSGEYKIDVICKTLSSEYWGYIKAGAEAYAKDHPGVTVDVKGPPSRRRRCR